jgi:GNAT superfamily N-acetyltransferase
MDNPAHHSLNNLTFRRASLPDLEAYLRLRMAMLEELSLLPSEPLRMQLWDVNRQYFQENLAQETYLAWLAESQGDAVAISGLLLFRRPPTGENMTGLDGYVMNMYTLPEWRGQGIASRLMQMIIDEGRHRHAGRLWLHATPNGRPIYARFGFYPVNQDLSAGDAIEMERKLQHDWPVNLPPG